jgi:hypothetical protein
MDMKRMEKEGKRDKELKSADKLLWILIENLQKNLKYKSKMLIFSTLATTCNSSETGADKL